MQFIYRPTTQFLLQKQQQQLSAITNAMRANKINHS